MITVQRNVLSSSHTRKDMISALCFGDKIGFRKGGMGDNESLKRGVLP